jgi:hypothetical protein
MPNADFHLPVAALAGAAAALTLAPQDGKAALLELLGGAVGGLLGGSAPDVFDPPNSPRHRSVGHGVFTSGAALVWCGRWLPRAQAALRQPRSSPRALAGEPPAGPRGSSAPFDPVGHFLAGVAAGFVAGYASHLLLDAMTPAGLPAFA